MSLKYEFTSEPLHIYADQLFLNMQDGPGIDDDEEVSAPDIEALIHLDPSILKCPEGDRSAPIGAIYTLSEPSMRNTGSVYGKHSHLIETEPRMEPFMGNIAV
jgi:hypothetical protein